MTELENIIARCKSKWLIGGSALPDIKGTPLESYLKELKEDELTVLALVAHSLKTSYLPKAPENLQVAAPLPGLNLPYLEGQARSAFKRVLFYHRLNKGKKEDIYPIISWLASRGYVPNPTDWMPTSSTEALPEVYTPWLQWLDTGEVQTVEQETELSEETWEQFYPAERIKVLKKWRETQPEEALDLIAQKAPAEPAEKRLALVGVLEQNLGEYDIEFLESLKNDRSQKVKSLVQRLLIRLGKYSNSQEDIQELVDFFSRQKKLGKTKITFRNLKNRAQRNRRDELLAQISLSELAQAFELSIADFIQQFSFHPKEEQGNLAFLKMASEFGTEEQLSILAAHLLASNTISLQGLSILSNRLSDKKKIELAEKTLDVSNEQETGFQLAKSVLAEHLLGILSWESIQKSKNYKKLLRQLKKFAKEKDYEDAQEVFEAFQSLETLGLLATAKAAQNILQDLVTIGAEERDTNFLILQLNVML